MSAGAPNPCPDADRDPLGPASAALQAGDPMRARRLLDDAALASERRGDRVNAALAKAFASDLCRMAGDLQSAYERAAEAADLARSSGDRRALAASYTALGEAQLARAGAGYAANSLGWAGRYEVDRFRLARLWRRRGVALWADRAPRSAGWSLGRAAALFRELGDLHTEVSVLVERATALAGVDDEPARQARAEARAAAEAASRPDALLALGLLDAARLLDAHQLAEAEAELRRVREEALAIIDPIRYIMATLGLAVLAQQQGADVDAYGQLASGWVTIGDLLGADAGAAAFRPAIQAVRNEWGDDRFAAAKDGYETRRRAAIGTHLANEAEPTGGGEVEATGGEAEAAGGEAVAAGRGGVEPVGRKPLLMADFELLTFVRPAPGGPIPSGPAMKMTVSPTGRVQRTGAQGGLGHWRIADDLRQAVNERLGLALADAAAGGPGPLEPDGRRAQVTVTRSGKSEMLILPIPGRPPFGGDGELLRLLDSLLGQTEAALGGDSLNEFGDGILPDCLS